MFVNNQEEIIEHIECHAERSFPDECCGIVIKTCDGFAYLECENESQTPQVSFKIDQRRIARYYRLIEYIVHSHVNGSPKPSVADMRMSDELKKPLLIVSIPTLELCGYTPNSIKRDIEGREFFYAVNDCTTLIVDYYREVLGKKYTEPYRPRYGWWNSDSEFASNNMVNCLKGMGFFEVDTPENNDVVVMKFPGIAPSHAGIYVDGDIVHNMINKKGTRELYGALLRKYSVGFYRAGK